MFPCAVNRKGNNANGWSKKDFPRGPGVCNDLKYEQDVTREHEEYMYLKVKGKKHYYVVISFSTETGTLRLSDIKFNFKNWKTF